MKTRPLLESFDWATYSRAVVISPHLDDAVLSCAGLLAALEHYVSRLVVTVACGNPLPKTSAKKTARTRRGFTHPAERRREDVAAMEALGCDYVHLGFADCVYRRSPTSGELIYRNARTKWSVANVEDSGYMEELYLVLRRLCQNMGRVLVVAPLGIGYHVDHSICAHIALRLASAGCTVLFYEDVPYVLRPQVGRGDADGPLAAMERNAALPRDRLTVPYDAAQKASLVRCYESQVDALFGRTDDVESILASRTHEGRPTEFYWRAKPVARTAAERRKE